MEVAVSMWRFLSVAVVVLVILGKAAEIESHTKSECGVAETAFGMCVPYVMGEERSMMSRCCAAVRSVKELATTRAGRRGMCECLRRLMARVGRIDRGRALALPGKCGVRTNVIPPSLRYHCYKIA